MHLCPDKSCPGRNMKKKILGRCSLICVNLFQHWKSLRILRCNISKCNCCVTYIFCPDKSCPGKCKCASKKNYHITAFLPSNYSFFFPSTFYEQNCLMQEKKPTNILQETPNIFSFAAGRDLMKKIKINLAVKN